MTEHVWEYRVQKGNYSGNFEIMCICNSRCGHIPDDTRMLTRMLNAVKELNLDNAKAALEVCNDPQGYVDAEGCASALAAYANTLEGKDE